MLNKKSATQELLSSQTVNDSVKTKGLKIASLLCVVVAIAVLTACSRTSGTPVSAETPFPETESQITEEAPVSETSNETASPSASGIPVEVIDSHDDEDTPGAIEVPSIDAFIISKSPMTHTDTLSFSWTVPETYGARALDYLAPQLQEIFETIWTESTGHYYISERVAKKIPGNNSSLMRSYVAVELDTDCFNGISLLCFISASGDTMNVSVQVTSTRMDWHSDDADSDFWFADFTGDGSLDVFAKNRYFAASYVCETIGVFSFDDGEWGTPLFWSVDNKTPMPFDSGFELLDRQNPYVIRNNITGYYREIPIEHDADMYIGSLDYAVIENAVAADVDGDGIYELLIQQVPHHWPGACISLIKYESSKSALQVESAAFLLHEEMGGYIWARPSECWYKPFLTQLGYNVSGISFLD